LRRWYIILTRVNLLNLLSELWDYDIPMYRKKNQNKLSKSIPNQSNFEWWIWTKNIKLIKG